MRTATDMHRVREGYGALAGGWPGGSIPRWSRSALGRVVRAIRWRPGQVQVDLASADGAPAGSAAAAQAVVTLPLGVLRRAEGEPGAVGIDPWPEGWRRCARPRSTWAPRTG